MVCYLGLFALLDPTAETLRSPTATFVLLLAITLIVPPVFERLKLPGLVGLLAAGVLFGTSVLGWLNPAAETMKLLSEIGKIYLMFVAGLEIDLALFQKTRNRSLTFGVLTFIIPFVGGTVLGLLFNFGWLAAVLIGSLLASHTLLAYPIVQRIGLVSDEAITITVGATIFTDITALLVLAICLGVNQGDFTAGKLAILLGSLGLYTIAVLFGLKQLAKAFFSATGKDEGNQFLFVMLSVFLAAVSAQLIGVEAIIGAFLAGLAINDVIGHGPVKEKTEFVGSVLFIPMFFINMGLLLDLKALGSLFQFIALPLCIVVTLIGTKFLAALGTQKIFKYSWPQTYTMWSLSLPQVAATLAAALAGYQANIIDVQVFNSIILLMLTTAIMGPLITAKGARRMALDAAAASSSPLSWLPVPQTHPPDSASSAQLSSPLSNANAFTVVVPVYNPKTELWLLELATMIAHYEKGQVIPLAIALAQPKMDAPQLERAITRSRDRLHFAVTIRTDFPVPLTPVLRIEYSVHQAICHVSREKDASLIVLGMGTQPNFHTLGSIHSDVMWSAHCPVIIARLLTSPTRFKNILLPIETLSPFTIRVLRFAQVLAATHRGKITLLPAGSALSSQQYCNQLQERLQLFVSQLPPADCQIEIAPIVRDDFNDAIARSASSYDAIVMRFQRRRGNSGLSLSSNTYRLASLKQSIIFVGEPPIAQTHPQFSE